MPFLAFMEIHQKHISESNMLTEKERRTSECIDQNRIEDIGPNFVTT